MKILAIRIRNLASLEGVTEIDFTKEPLKSAGIFAITGPTGAGKSTILDALCLALYAKTPRYAQATENVNILDVEGATINQKDVRSILRDGTSDGAAEVDFVGIDGNHYKAGWYVRRAGNKPDGKLQSDTVRLENITNRTPFPGKKKETLDDIERLIGLSFEQFTRSVLLAQGDFTAFLKAAKDEKASLLEKLTGVRIYSEISMRIFEKNKEVANELYLLRQTMGGITLMLDEDVQDHLEQELAYQKQIEGTTQSHSTLQKATEWLELINKLQQETDTARMHLELAKEKRQTAVHRQQTLKQVDAVQKARVWVEGIDEVDKQIVSQNDEAVILKTNLAALREQMATAQNDLLATEQNLLAAKKIRVEADPSLEKARELDVLLNERKAQTEVKEKELSAQKIALQRQADVIAQSKATIATQQETITSIRQWQTQNKQRESIAENVTLILSKLVDAGATNDEMLSAEKQLSAEQKLIKDSRLKIEEHQLLSNQLVKELEKQYNFLAASEQKLKDLNAESIGTNIKLVDDKAEGVRIAMDEWNQLLALKGELQMLADKSVASSTKLLAIESIYAESKLALKEAEIRKITAEELVKKAILQNNASVKRLRDQLIEGDPCPVCGSTTHPFTNHNAALDSLMDVLESSASEEAEKYREALQKNSSLHLELAHLKQTIQEANESINQKEIEQSNRQLQWNVDTSLPYNLPDNDEQVKEALKTLWSDIKKEKQLLQLQLDTVVAENKKIVGVNAQITTVKKDIDSITNQIKDAERVVIGSQENTVRLEKEITKARNEIAAITDTLSPYFQGKDWIQHWKNDASAFVEKIIAFATLWKTKNQKLEETDISYQVAIAKLEKEENSFSREQESFQAKEVDYNSHLTLYHILLKERMLLFNGATANEIELKLDLAIDVAGKLWDEGKNRLEGLRNAEAGNTAREASLLESITTQEQRKLNYRQQLSKWINEYNAANELGINEYDIKELLSYSHEWIDEERRYLKETEDAVTSAIALYNERLQKLELHVQIRLTDKTFDELKTLMNAAEVSLEKEKEQLNEIRYRLRQNDENKKKTGHLEKQILVIQEVSENWGKLNDLIGSSDGKKFRQVAQEYTLDVLLAYANYQMNTLSKRYFIQRIPDSLSLQVIDKDMGDEIRSIYSLSGGESFLVSLALALGLASLSSSQIQVESLFIDEGFGSLDPLTLTTVMDALDRLHNQGRKVGVISHVEEMTERIPAQIKVVKLTNGRSKVETTNALRLF